MIPFSPKKSPSSIPSLEQINFYGTYTQMNSALRRIFITEHLSLMTQICQLEIITNIDDPTQYIDMHKRLDNIMDNVDGLMQACTNLKEHYKNLRNIYSTSSPHIAVDVSVNNFDGLSSIKSYHQSNDSLFSSQIFDFEDKESDTNLDDNNDSSSNNSNISHNDDNSDSDDDNSSNDDNSNSSNDSSSSDSVSSSPGNNFCGFNDGFI